LTLVPIASSCADQTIASRYQPVETSRIASLLMAARAPRTSRRSKLPAVLLLLVFLAFAAAIALAPGPAAPQPAAAADGWYASVRTACRGNANVMLCYHSRTRALAGLPKLRPSRILERSAALKAARIVRCKQHRHSPCGDAWVRPFYAAGYVPTRGRTVVGENLAWGWSSPWEAFDALMHSPTHRANILDPDFRDVGVRVVRRSPWGPLYVLHYGRRG
jgi:uncharacterized protein YkwD